MSVELNPSLISLKDLASLYDDDDAVDAPDAGLPGDGNAKEELQVRQGLGAARQGSLERTCGQDCQENQVRSRTFTRTSIAHFDEE